MNEFQVGDRYRIPAWKWFPEKYATVVYVTDKYVVISIDGEERPEVGEKAHTEDWEKVE